MYVYERDWKEYEGTSQKSAGARNSGQRNSDRRNADWGKTGKKRTELELIGQRRPEQGQREAGRSIQREMEPGATGRKRMKQRIDEGKQEYAEIEETSLNRNRSERSRVSYGGAERIESGRERREIQLRQKKLRERKLREKELRRKRRVRRCRILTKICLVAAVVALFVGRDAWMGKVQRWVKSNLAGFSQTAPGVRASSLNPEIYPQSLQELFEKNPEAEQFVLDYPKNKDKHPEINLSGEVTQGTIPLFIQWDERWGYENYGGDFIAVTGCGPTCLSMVYCGLRGETGKNPFEVAQWAEREGYYVNGAGSSWDLMSQGALDLGLTQVNVIFDAEHILGALRNGTPIICAMRPGDFTTTGHFIVLSGVDEDDKVIVRDPNSRVRSEKKWKVEDLMPQIKNLWGYQ